MNKHGVVTLPRKTTSNGVQKSNLQTRGNKQRSPDIHVRKKVTKKREYVSTKAVIGIGISVLILLSVAGAILFHLSNDSDTSQWLKTNFFPADEYGFTSLMDADVPASQEYQGSTSSAWVLTGIFSGIILLVCFIYFARERGFFE